MVTIVFTRVADEISEDLGFLQELILRMQDGAVSASGVVRFPRVEGAAVRQLVVWVVAVVEGEAADVVLGSMTKLNCFILQSSSPV